MNNESMKNRRIIAMVIVIAIIGLSIGSDYAFNKGTIEDKRVQKEITSVLGFKDGFREEIISDGNKSERILVVPINGTIQGNTVGFNLGEYDHNLVMKTLLNVKDDKTIKGIILAVDSPGGTVYHSAELWNVIKQLKDETKLPIYSSMGTVAASGGYYVSAPADKIFAVPETTTGSIGVIADYVNYGALEEKLGVKHNVMKSGDHKDIGSASREMTEEDRAILQSLIDESYENFVNVVAEGRGMAEDQVKKLADGRIYSGSQAVKNGLVDEIGYLGDSIEAMKAEIGSENPQVFQVRGSEYDYLQKLLTMKYENKELGLLRQIKGNYGDGNSPRILYMYGGY